MKRMLRYFRILGDALGLVVLLGGLMVATNNTRAVKETSAQRRKLRAAKPAPALNARRAAI